METLMVTFTIGEEDNKELQEWGPMTRGDLHEALVRNFHGGHDWVCTSRLIWLDVAALADEALRRRGEDAARAAPAVRS